MCGCGVGGSHGNLAGKRGDKYCSLFFLKGNFFCVWWSLFYSNDSTVLILSEGRSKGDCLSVIWRPLCSLRAVTTHSAQEQGSLLRFIKNLETASKSGLLGFKYQLSIFEKTASQKDGPFRVPPDALFPTSHAFPLTATWTPPSWQYL